MKLDDPEPVLAPIAPPSTTARLTVSAVIAVRPEPSPSSAIDPAAAERLTVKSAFFTRSITVPRASERVDAVPHGSPAR